MLQPAPFQPQERTGPIALVPLDRFAGSLGNRVYLTLRDAILSLTYRPGEILRKPEICAALNVSRSPVADAVARLASEGLVDVVPQAGTYVARFSMAEIREGAFLREAIEVAAVERIAATIAEADLIALRRNIAMQAVLVESGDFSGFYQLDGEMHQLLLSMTGFRRLPSITSSAWVHVDRARRLLLPMPGRIAATLAEHQDILAALEARDADAAGRAISRHLGQLIRFLEPLERDRPELFA
jgi:GntR family transcriptional regulator, rspAB operon transcriptional repressor